VTVRTNMENMAHRDVDEVELGFLSYIRNSGTRY
jgi:hypothetical protein